MPTQAIKKSTANCAAGVAKNLMGDRSMQAERQETGGRDIGSNLPADKISRLTLPSRWAVGKAEPTRVPVMIRGKPPRDGGLGRR